MFKQSISDKQTDLFSSVASNMTGKAKKLYDDKKAWHNLFRTQILQRIDETPYQVLYSNRMGAPNASVSMLFSMMIIKEAYGWSDDQLFEQCRFNLLVRSALGLINMTDDIPGESTYYLLRQRVQKHFRLTGQDLFQETYAAVTSGQIKDFKVNGQSIRMDSKLIGSNIAWYSRYEIVHSSLCMFYKTLDKKALSLFTRPVRLQLEELFKEEADKTVYRSNRNEIKLRLHHMGGLIIRMLKHLKKRQDTEEYQLLQRVFDENYVVIDKLETELRENQQMTSDSVQSPHDPDAAYRNKGDQKIKGYSVNVTETSSENSLNLITNAIVDKANVSDVSFVQPAIEATTEVTGQAVEKVYADGAYQSPDNDTFCEDIDMVFTGMQGEPSRYELEMADQGLMVTDTYTGQTVLAPKAKRIKSSKEDRYYIRNSEGKVVYFGQAAIRASRLRQKMRQRPLEELRKRNNVEATIFHLAFPLRNNKTKYRGLFKQQVWANCRCLWINLVRIMNFMQKICQRTFQSVLKPASFHLIPFNHANQVYVYRKNWLSFASYIFLIILVNVNPL
jgi:hypothetical protein